MSGVMYNKKKSLDGTTAETCPIFLTLALLGNKWAICTLHYLHEAKKHRLRFGELQKLIEFITHKELAKQLKEFEQAGIVKRHVYNEMPPRVEYSLTPLGVSLQEPIKHLSTWAEKHGSVVQKNRQKHLK